MATFNFPYHTFSTENPETGFRAKFGGSYVFTAVPDSPDQRVFKLNYPIMKFFTSPDGSVNSTDSPLINMKTMIDFYHEHKLHKTFVYEHPIYGNVNVKFNKPLPEPLGIPNGQGAVESFEVELVEIP